jgi:hypothetical protein
VTIVAESLVAISDLCKVISGLDFVHQPYEVFVPFICQLLEFTLVLFQPWDLIAGLFSTISILHHTQVSKTDSRPLKSRFDSRRQSSQDPYRPQPSLSTLPYYALPDLNNVSTVLVIYVHSTILGSSSAQDSAIIFLEYASTIYRHGRDIVEANVQEVAGRVKTLDLP